MESQQIEILLIEDNPHEAELTIRSLKKSNLANNLIHIDDGEEALEFIFSKGKHAHNKGKFSPKLILLDLKLPKVSGLEILQKLKADNNTKHIPIVILTSSREEVDVVNGYNLGVNSYIVKPVNFDAFSQAIGEIGLYWMLLNKLPSAF